jgi:coenzyme F420-reducing hydrogenase alpha subunit
VEALRVVREYEPPPQPRVEVGARSGVGQAITEAPRGILWRDRQDGGDIHGRGADHH